MGVQRAAVGAYALWEQNPHICRTEGKVLAGADMQSGTVVGKITASSALVPWDPTESDGSETLVGILFNDVDAPATDEGIIYHKAGDMVVRKGALIWKTGLSAGNKTTGIAALVALGIRVVDEAVTGTNV